MEQGAFPIVGWEIKRNQGGANQIVGRKRLPDRIAHPKCVQLHVKGLDQQGTLAI